MAEPEVAGRGEQGWVRPLLALAILALVPLFPPLRVLAPIEKATMLLVPAIAACALVAWVGGGRGSLALIWVLLAVWVMTRPIAGPSAQFEQMARGWSLLVSGCFAACGLFMSRRAFLTRALTTVAVALGAAVGIAAATGGGASAVSGLMQLEIAERNAGSLAMLQESLSASPTLRDIIARNADWARMPEMLAEQLGSLAHATAVLYPALVALETLAALAIAWALFHRVSRARIGAPLARLRDFRFSDQLVWGLLLGASLLLLPTLKSLEAPGWNLVVFFGGLYALRGLGIVAWFLAPAGKVVMILVGVVLVALPVPGSALTLGLGLGDTWLDWRNRPRPAT